MSEKKNPHSEFRIFSCIFFKAKRKASLRNSFFFSPATSSGNCLFRQSLGLHLWLIDSSSQGLLPLHKGAKSLASKKECGPRPTLAAELYRENKAKEKKKNSE